MLRLQENTPEIYLKESRDFQIMCRIYDMLNNAVRFNIESTRYLLDPRLCNDKVLELLCTRVGFFPKKEYNTNILRSVVSAFPFLLKYKGSKKGIELAVDTILKAEQHFGESSIDISTPGLVKVYLTVPLSNQDLLYDVLTYILPVGYDIIIEYSKPLRGIESQIAVNSGLDYAVVNDNDISVVASSSIIQQILENPTVENNATGTFTTSNILSSENN